MRTTARAATAPSSARTGLAGVAQAVEERLAGLRGEAARAYAGSLIARALPTNDAARRSAVLEALNNGTPSLCWVGLLAIPHTGPIDEEMFRALLRQTGTGLPYLDTAAQTVLETAAGVTEGAATRMWLVARTAPARLRAALYRSLATHRPADGRKEVLREALRASDPSVRRAAAFALLQLLPDVPPHPHPHADLLENLTHTAKSDPDDGARSYAVSALARLGPAAAPSAGGLTGLLQDPSGRVRSGVMQALAAIGDPALPALREALRRQAHGLTDAVVNILQQIGTPAAEGLLREGLTDPDPYVRGRCAIALHAMKARNLHAVELYRRLLRERDGEVVLLALEGLSQAGADARLVLDDIRHLSEHADANVRRAASVLLDLLEAR